MNQQKTTCACCGAEPTEAELAARLDEIIAEYRDRPGGLIPVLQIAQGLYGHLPEAVITRIARGLGKSVSEVAGVVGFYSFFSTVPRGKHLVRVCLGTACYVRGGKAVLDAFRGKLGIEVGGTTPDRQFSLEVARCFGACGLAPAIMIDETVHHRVKPSRVGRILALYSEEAPQRGEQHQERSVQP
jgi:NADH:ubiquinone oxidoreductase subunit E